MNYRIEFSKSASKQFRKLPSGIKKRVKVKIDELAREPRPNNVKKIQGDERSYRIRVGDYRIIYEIEDAVLLITVIKIKHRSEVYKDKK
ncbi:MAG: type II toxin-antitoxin system RelE/ParE family toxin [Cyanobacteria bacterium P01_G01_bin.19]